jgi:RimJ/RimL family protein N-acetyltransferase
VHQYLVGGAMLANAIVGRWTFLARSHWGGSCNADMKRLMLDHAFRFVRSVVFVIGPHNLRSQRAVKKIGAVRAGTRREEDGRESVVYRITAADRTTCDQVPVTSWRESP